MIKKVVHNIHRTQKTPMNCPLMSTLTDDEKACTISGTESKKKLLLTVR